MTYMYSLSHSGEGPTDFHERAHARTHLIGLSSVPPMTMNSSKISLFDMPATSNTLAMNSSKISLLDMRATSNTLATH